MSGGLRRLALRQVVLAPSFDSWSLRVGGRTTGDRSDQAGEGEDEGTAPQGTVVVGEHTVHRHMANVCGKLGIPSRAAAVVHAASRDFLWGPPFRLPDQHGPNGPSFILPGTWPGRAKPFPFVPA